VRRRSYSRPRNGKPCCLPRPDPKRGARRPGLNLATDPSATNTIGRCRRAASALKRQRCWKGWFRRRRRQQRLDRSAGRSENRATSVSSRIEQQIHVPPARLVCNPIRPMRQTLPARGPQPATHLECRGGCKQVKGRRPWSVDAFRDAPVVSLGRPQGPREHATQPQARSKPCRRAARQF